MLLKIIISTLAILLTVAHLFITDFSLDTTALILLVISVIPWISHLLKSMEFPGGLKFEFKELQSTTDKAMKIGLISKNLTDNEEKEYSFQLIQTDDPILALAGLRIEIEKRLKNIAQQKNIGTNMQGIGNIVRNLKNHEIIGQKEFLIINDLIFVLNKAVHAENLDKRTIDWTMFYGPRILKALDEAIELNK